MLEGKHRQMKIISLKIKIKLIKAPNEDDDNGFVSRIFYVIDFHFHFNFIFFLVYIYRYYP